MANDGLNRTKVISVIPSAEDKNIFLRITDYTYEEHNDKIILAAIYNKKSYLLEVHNDVLDYKQYPNSMGKLFAYIDGHIFFIDDAKDMEGEFN